MEQDGASRRGFLTACGSASAALLVASPPWARAAQKRPGELYLDNNENPLGPSRRAAAAAFRALDRLNRYPDFESEDLREALAKRFRLKPEQVVTGCGSTEVIQQAVLAFLGPGRELITAEPDFFIPALLAERVGARTVTVPVRNDHRLDLRGMAARVGKNTGLVYVCNPLNPLGTYVPWPQLQAFLEGLPPRVPVLVDEAYRELMLAADYRSAVELVRKGRANLLVTRTFSKAQGLAALRVGYGLCVPEMAKHLVDRSTPVALNLLAQEAALAALSDEGHLRRTRRTLDVARRYTLRALRELRLNHVESSCPFIAFQVPHPKAVHRKLAQRKVHIGEPLEKSRFAGYLRVSMGTPEQMRRFIATLRAIL